MTKHSLALPELGLELLEKSLNTKETAKNVETQKQSKRKLDVKVRVHAGPLDDLEIILPSKWAF